MIQKLKSIIALDNPLRLGYHLIRAIIANIRYGFPSKGMTIIWVTGTNGKTTVCNIIGQGLKLSGRKVFMYTTVNVMIWEEVFANPNKMTSPDVFELQRLLAIAKKEWCDIAVIETASHGIKMHRIWGLDYDISVLTNISQDHLDLHRTMDDYVNTKLKIFKKLMYYKRKPWVKKTGVINIDSDYKDVFLAETYDSLYTYGSSYESNIRAEDIQNTKSSMNFRVNMPWDDIIVKTKLRWSFNIMNILAAIWVFASLWISKSDIEKWLAIVKTVPGRMEEIKSKEGFSVFIDYAHTPDALEKVLDTLSEMKWEWRIITVFWACGDRDKTNRPTMWSVISRLSDVVILTQDDDYSESPQDIIKDILPGVDRKQWEDFWIIIDRKEAIRTALVMAQKWDIVLIAGKWDEHVRVTNQWHVPWHDKTIAEGILKDIDDNTIMK